MAVVACSDDGGGATPTDGGSSATPTGSVSVTTPAVTPTATPGDSTPTPTFRPVDADYYAFLASDPAALLEVLGTGEIAERVPDCTYDEPNMIIDCTVAGVGTIALDAAPGGVVTECRGLILPSTNRLFAASCNTEDVSVFIYKIEE